MSLDVEVLRMLRSGAGSGAALSATQIARRLGVSPSSVWAAVNDLRRVGYVIESTPHLGYQLAASPDALHADDILSRLKPVRVIGRKIQVFQQTTSTNEIADQLARSGVAEGAAVFAESQTRGRGRLGRSWSSAAGRGLWFSVLLRPFLQPRAITQLTIAAATAIVRAVSRATDLRAEIKWPNDIVLGGRKLAGILTEAHTDLDRVRWVILGIGMNANHLEADFPEPLRELATSLRLHLDRAVDRAALAAELLFELDADYQRVSEGRFEAVAEEWETRCATLGAQVCIAAGNRRIRGRAESLDPDGALLVRTQHGHLERATGGDVTIEPA